MSPYFSIVIPLYNKEKHIENTIKSVLEQTVENFEIIVINDGSTDNSFNKVKAINDSRIKLYYTENKGVSHARNFGIKKAPATLIAFLDADDIWYNHHLEDLKKLFEVYPNCGLYCKAYVKQQNNFIMKSVYKNIPKQVNWMGVIDDYFESSLINCVAWTSAVAIPKQTLEDINNFDESITLGAGEDIDLWLRIALKHPVAFYNKISAIHKLHANNRISNSNTNDREFINLDTYELIAQNNKSLKKYLDLNRFSIAIQYRLIGNTTKANDYIEKIDETNLNKKQIFLLKSNVVFLKLLLNLKGYLKTININLSTYK